VKKSRALSTPVEADENDNDEEEFADAYEHDIPTPSPQPSPPHETKTRQPSQGPDDTGLRNGQSERQDSADAAPAPVAPDNATTPDAQPQIGTSSLTPAATIPKMQNQTDVVEISSPGGVAAKDTIEETAVTTSVEHDAAPSAAAPVPTATEEVQVRPTTSAMPIPQPDAQSTQKIDNQTSLVPIVEARTDSNSREVKRPTPPLSEGDNAAKRPREDEDGDLDPNPREAKRASPPPEKEKEKEKEKKERPARKKSVADAHAQSTLASPRATPASAFVGCLCRYAFQAMGMLICS
jgi:Ran-binding protein 3